MKKFILYFLATVGLLVVAFVGIGFIIPSVEYTTTVEINKPHDLTWKIFRERKDWIDGFKSAERISGQPEEIGSKAKLIVVRDGTEYVFVSELIDIKPPELVTSKLDNDLLVHQATVQMIDEVGKTKVVSSEKITGKNFFLRSLFPLFRSRFTSVSTRNFEGLKRVVESSE